MAGRASLAPETVVKILIGLAIVVIAALLFSKWGFKAEESISSLMPDTACPANAQMSDFVAKMRAFSPKDSPSSEPAYAINVFKDYLSCAYPKTGLPRFTDEELKKDEPQILSCTSVAFDNYLEYLLKQKEESKGYPDDLKHYDLLLKDATHDKMVFNVLFPGNLYSGAVCTPGTATDEHYSSVYGVIKGGVRFDYRFSRISNSWEYNDGSEWKDVKNANQNTVKVNYFWILTFRLVNVNEDDGPDKMLEFFEYQSPVNKPDDLLIDGKSVKSDSVVSNLQPVS